MLERPLVRWGGNSPQYAKRSSVGLWLTHVAVALFTGAAVALFTGTGHAAEPSAGPVVESTGFEQSDGWCPGFVCGPEFFNCFEPLNDPTTNCGPDNPNPATGWHLSQDAQSCLEPHIDTANPFAGSRHLRFTQDPTLVDYDKRVKRTPEHLRTWRAGSS